MKTEEFLRRYEMLVPEMLADNRELIIQGMTKGIDFQENMDAEIYVKMIGNSISIAAQAAVQITLKILAEANVINDANLEYVEFKKPPLNLVKGGKGDGIRQTRHRHRRE